MKTRFIIPLLLLSLLAIAGCQQTETVNQTENNNATEAPLSGGQATVVDDVSQQDIVKAAIASPDHNTLVQAVQAAGLVNALSNAGPFTVYAPTDAAFAALPKGTVEDLMQPKNAGQLSDVLQYHVTLSVFEEEKLTDGLSLGQVNGGNIKITRKGDDIFVNDAKIIGSLRVTNGIIHVIDKVLTP